MKPEQTQRGNPHKLAISQHVFPVGSIKRFANPDGKVSVTFCQTDKQIRVFPRHKIFCAERVWDQRAETGYMKEVEDKFQAVADQIVDGRKSLDSECYRTVRMFFALWCLRSDLRNNPISDKEIVGIEPDPLSLDQQEILEANGGAYLCPDRKLPGRVVGGFRIQTDIYRFEARFADLRWGIARAVKGEFILPDTFGQLLAVPVTPTIFLVGGHEDMEVLPSEVSRFNRLAVQSAKVYFVARDPAHCPR
jgi:hypothetical protein